MADETIKYTGDGNSYYVGVPMRDLTRDEFNRLDTEQAGLVLQGVLYEVPPTLKVRVVQSDATPHPSSAAAEVVAATAPTAPPHGAPTNPAASVHVDSPIPVVVDAPPHD